MSREQVRSGEKLLARLSTTPVSPSAALWAKTEYDGQVYLYIVSPLVEQDSLEGARLLVAALRDVQPPGTDPFDEIDLFGIKLISPNDRLAQGVLELYHHWPDSTPTWHGGSVLGPVNIDGAYIYPAKMFAPSQPQPTP